MSFSIEGKTAIVTGAASGVGLAIARSFAERGANVMCADIDEARLHSELGDVSDEGSLRYFAGDLRERLTIANLVSATIDAFDEVDILVNAARRIVATDALDPEDDTVDALFDQNVLTAFRLSQQVAKRMMRQAEGRDEGQSGAIVNISSIASGGLRPELLGYSIAAAGLDQVTRGLALVLAPHRIRVNSLAIGSVMSASLKDLLKDHPDWREEIEARTPLQRIAGPTELVDAVQFLASEGSSFITGEIVTIDGGRSILDPVSAPAH